MGQEGRPHRSLPLHDMHFSLFIWVVSCMSTKILQRGEVKLWCFICHPWSARIIRIAVVKRKKHKDINPKTTGEA
jgi:hypothetical protein